MSFENSENQSMQPQYRTQRPDYPHEIVGFIKGYCQPDKSWQIADIGSGAGVSTNFLSWGLKIAVFAVEPDDKLRSMAEQNEEANPYFHSVKGTAENTALPDNSVNLVCAFEAFQWFDKSKARVEFRRILRSPGYVLIAFSEKATDKCGFTKDYETLLSTFPEYQTAMHPTPTLDEIKVFLNNENIMTEVFFVNLELDWDGLMDRFISAFYTPQKGSPQHDRSILQLREAYNKHARMDRIELSYKFTGYLGEVV